jgi:putative transcriptional regulator
MIKKEQALKKLGKRIREVRKEKGVSQVELANSIGKDQQSIQRLESGNINPSYYFLLEVADGLNIELTELLGSA